VDETAENLVDFTLETKFDVLSQPTIEACKSRLLDTIGCLAGGFNHPVFIAARNFSERFKMETSATILGTGVSASPDMAAFANSVGIRVLDMNDNYRVKSGGHPSDIIGALFAGSEIGEKSGASFLTAMAIGYEIYCRLCDAVDINGQGWDQPVCGVCASALTVGKLIGLNRKELLHSLSMALIPNMAMIRTRQGQLSSWKGCAAANAARNGVFAALLAKEGFTAPSMPIEGRHGLWDVVGKFNWNIEKGLSPERILNSDIKAFPICVHGQTAVWIALEIRKQISLNAIENIHIDTYHRGYEMMCSDQSRWSPSSRETADHSLPYVVAVALLEGAVDDASFTTEMLKNTQLSGLIKKITASSNPEMSAMHPESMPCRITVGLKNGSQYTHTLKYQKGHPANPMTEKELESKFSKLFSKFGNEKQSEEVINLVSIADRLEDMSVLIAALERRS
tara:strand:- start:748 stop:2103 length:1356 start_codon:yes stop_codon:yes gene_type:complete